MSPYVTEDDLKSGEPLDLVMVDHDGSSVTLLEWVNNARAAAFASDYSGVSHAGIAIVAADTGRVLLTKRADDPTDEEGVRDTWEFPGGGLKDGEEPYPGAVREYIEETGLALPDGRVMDGWREGNWQGFVYVTPVETPVEGWTPTTEVADVGWFDHDAVMGLINVGALRKELVATMDWSLVFPETEDEMTKDALTAAAQVTDEDPTDYTDVFALPIPIHGVLAPEEVATGDGRGFAAGSMTSRPLRFPFRWQESDIGQHNGAYVVGSVDRLMRKDGLIHYEGQLMPSARADEFAGLMQFFDGRYGVSVDGDNGKIDTARSAADGMYWFEKVRASGLTAVDIPAFAEAFVAFGPHPDMPEEDDEQYAVMVASGNLVGQSFKRGPGWVTNPEDTRRIHDYWTKKGEPGYAKIGWGTPGDFARAKALIGEKIAKNSPEKMRFLNQIIAQWHFDALGYWPATHAKMERDAKASSDTETFKDYTAEERKNAHTLPDGSFPIEDCADLANAIQAIGRAKDPAAAKSHIRSRKSALGCPDVTIPETWAVEDSIIVMDSEGLGWEAVLTSSAGVRARPPMAYFDRHPDTDALVIEEPDANGLRRTYGYAAEWGVCHIGHEGRCVEVPEDPDGGTFPTFHLGRTKTAEGEYINTGVVTYKVDHRDAKTILTETAEQQHFDNIKHAWAAVRVGQDERGIWFSGVVLPNIPEDDIVLIEATGQVSGEWKYGALRACQAVNVAGFPVLRSSAAYDDEGEVIALVASAHTPYKCGESPADRMAALRQIDAEVRFAALREQFLAERSA